jgi:hypothetical protein
MIRDGPRKVFRTPKAAEFKLLSTLSVNVEFQVKLEKATTSRCL